VKNKKEIEALEERNSELAKEILLNEAAIYEAEKEINRIDTDIIDHPTIQNYINTLKMLIERLETKNTVYKNEIFENDVRIKKLSYDN
jgi:predicted RNase H-like nuclease (RuvC/YqgF family)